MDDMLDEFADLLASSMTLPPTRTQDHRIRLLPNATPVVVCPYRYVRLHKNELKRQCADMLQQGLIRTSDSVFSSPVLLIKKHDGSWRFCVDY